MTEKKRRIIQPGERLALYPPALRSNGSIGEDGQPARHTTEMWWDLVTAVPQNERIGDVAIVSVRGALDHHRGFGEDNYESIRERVEMALTGACDDEDPQDPPSAIILRIDSPGGVVSGLNETVRALRESFTAAGIPSVAFVDELAASAAYALACSCDEIVMASETAIAGSVGVIACMYDQVEADKKAGINVVTITSGARKADGHPHVPVSDDAVAAERGRVARSAKAFYRLVSAARGLSPKVIKGYEAGIFQGSEATDAGLADAVACFEDVVAALSDNTGMPYSNGVKKKGVANGGQPESESVKSGTASATSSKRPTMTVTLKTRIRSTEAALAKETDPTRKKALTSALAQHKAALAALTASIEAAKKTKIKYEETTEESEEEEEESSSEESEEEEASGNETDRKENGDDDGDGDSDGDDDADEDEEEEEEEAKMPPMKKSARAAMSLLEQSTGKKGRAAIGAAAAMFAVMKQTTEDVARLKSAARAKEKSDLIASAKRYVPKAQLTWLKTQSLAVVRGFVEQATKGAPIVHTEEGELLRPKAAAPGTEESLPKDTIVMIDAAMAACPNGVKPEVFRKTLVDAHLADHKKRLASANGVGRI